MSLGIKNDRVFFFYLCHESLPVRSVLSSTGVEFSNDSCLWVNFCDVGNLASNALVFCGHTAISINRHKNSSCQS